MILKWSYRSPWFTLSPLSSIIIGVCAPVVLSAIGRWWCALALCLILLWNDDCSESRLSSDWHANSQVSQTAVPAADLQWAYEYDSGSDSDADRPDPDLVLDDLASRRFHSPSPAPPTNFAVPASPLAAGRAPGGRGSPWPKVTMTPSVVPQQNVTFLRSENMKQQCDFDVPA